MAKMIHHKQKSNTLNVQHWPPHTDNCKHIHKTLNSRVVSN